MLSVSAGHIYIDTDECDESHEGLTVKVVDGRMLLSVDLTIDEALRFRDFLNESIEEQFRKNTGICCPACGYVAEEAVALGDHQNCRRFPFFPGESGESFARP